ncbi:MAG: FRG domain-containing protein [Lachnospiraceae bacterium]|nr:FRG domain-containing protein [Lachnospiraceae bacterium]
MEINMDKLLANSFEEVYKIVLEIKQEHFKNTEMWFRGQGLNTYLLKPSLFRTKNGVKKERELFYEYVRLATGIGLTRNNDWENLIDMQHYGVPTRLLDWTSNLGIALYFATTSSINDFPMSLYIMDPLGLNELSMKNEIPILTNKTVELSYIDNYINRKPFPARYPIAVKCDNINSRVKAQSGMFTIHGDEDNDEEIDIITSLLDKKSYIYKIEISYKAHSSIKEYLDITGINDYTIFPDIQGIARHLSGILYS